MLDFFNKIFSTMCCKVLKNVRMFVSPNSYGLKVLGYKT